jgi:hypothetical protein
MESAMVPSQSNKYALNEPSGNLSFMRLFCFNIILDGSCDVAHIPVTVQPL